jgi:hypothetical protein
VSAGAMRFPSRGRWLLWLILLFVLGPFLVIVPGTLWLGWTMNPVESRSELLSRNVHGVLHIESVSRGSNIRSVRREDGSGAEA